MSESLTVLAVVILAFILLCMFGTVFMRLTFRRTVRGLLTRFREAQAFSTETARFVDELGVERRPLLKIGVLRDYSPQVLEALIKEDIVRMTDEGKIYLSEQTLSAHRLSALDRGKS